MQRNGQENFMSNDVCFYGILIRRRKTALSYRNKIVIKISEKTYNYSETCKNKKCPNCLNHKDLLGIFKHLLVLPI
jgi:hypothetical protein